MGPKGFSAATISTLAISEECSVDVLATRRFHPQPDDRMETGRSVTSTQLLITRQLRRLLNSASGCLVMKAALEGLLSICHFHQHRALLTAVERRISCLKVAAMETKGMASGLQYSRTLMFAAVWTYYFPDILVMRFGFLVVLTQFRDRRWY